MNKLQEMLKIAEIHASRIDYALLKLSSIFPIDVHKIKNLSGDEFLLIELLVNRFAKLQDFIGIKLIDAYFKEKKEIVDNLTMIDKLNKLERLEIIESVDMWQKMREVRNYLVHEYPDQQAATADHLNQLFELSPELLKILQRIKN